MVKIRLTESQYDWAKIPENLPRENLVFITAKTATPTVHNGDSSYPVRYFTPTELHESGASLRRREVGFNHGGVQRLDRPHSHNYIDGMCKFCGVIENAFTVDSQWNESTQSLEALVYFPTPFINLIRREESQGRSVKYSVEYTWRDEKRTDSGVEFVGLCFDRVDMILGIKAGDMNTSGRLVESQSLHLMEAEGSPLVESSEELKHLEESADIVMEHLGEPFAGFTDWNACIVHAKSKGVSNPDAWCGAIKVKSEPPKAKEAQLPEQTNTMSSPTDIIQTPVEGLDSPQPHVNVTGVGATTGEMGPLAPDPQPDNPDKNLNQEPAKEDIGHMDSFKKEGTDALPMGPDKTNNSIDNNNEPHGEECMEEKKLKEAQELPKEEPKKEEPKKEEPKKEEPAKPDPKDEEIKGLKESVLSLQKQVGDADKVKDTAVKDAEKRGKEAVVTKIREVIPESGFFGGNVVMNATRRVVEDVNRKLKEVE